MARKGESVEIGHVFEHADDCAECRADGRFEQEYRIPDTWTSLFLSALSERHGAVALVRRQRGPTRDLVVRARTSAALVAVEADLRRLYGPLNQSLAGALHAFCEQHLTKHAASKP